MTHAEPYLGNDQLHVGDGKGLVISNTAHNLLHTPKRVFTLSNMFLTLKKNYYLFNNFIVKILSFLSFTLLFSMSRISSPKNSFFPVGVKTTSMSFPSLLPHLCRKHFLSTSMPTSADIWHRHLGHPSSRILSLLASNKKVVCTSHHINFQCQASPLEKFSRLSLGPTGHILYFLAPLPFRGNLASNELLLDPPLKQSIRP